VEFIVFSRHSTNIDIGVEIDVDIRGMSRLERADVTRYGCVYIPVNVEYISANSVQGLEV